MKFWCYGIVACYSLGWLAPGGSIAETPARLSDSRPNILIIMSDDMGYSDIGCYGGEIQTPNLDRLAAGGLRFTQFYNCGRCCPTRASLLTGLYPHQAGIGWMVSDQGLEGYRGELGPDSVTVAEVLRDSGYGTYAVGKWHVTKHVDPRSAEQKFNWPLQRGFDRYYGIINGASSLWDPNSLTRDNQPVTIFSDRDCPTETPYHVTDAFSDNAAAYIREHDFSAKPMFLYLAYTAAHWPMHARQRDIEKYDGQYDAGYEPIRQARLARMKQLGVISRESSISSLAGKWQSVPDRVWEADCMEVYAAMIDQMDQGVGRVIAALDARGELDNTLILFLQDNGGCAEEMGRDPDPAATVPRGPAPSLPVIPDDLLHYFSSDPKQTRDGWPVRKGHVTPGPADTYIAYGKNWASVSNTPLREYKHFVHEGGISTPLIAHWPRRISDRNQLRHEPCHLIDIMATCVEVAGASCPTERAGVTVLPIEGVSLLGAFDGRGLEREAIFWEHEGNRAIRMGKWKLVAKGSMRDRQQPVKWELYDIERDRIEMNDLAADQAERVRFMASKWEKWAWRAKVYPSPRPADKKGE